MNLAGYTPVGAPSLREETGSSKQAIQMYMVVIVGA